MQVPTMRRTRAGKFIEILLSTDHKRLLRATETESIGEVLTNVVAGDTEDACFDQSGIVNWVGERS